MLSLIVDVSNALYGCSMLGIHMLFHLTGLGGTRIGTFFLMQSAWLFDDAEYENQ